MQKPSQFQNVIGSLLSLCLLGALLCQSWPYVSMAFVCAAAAIILELIIYYYFIRPQSRIAEWLVTAFVAGIQAAAIRALWPPYAGGNGETICVVVALAATLLGSGFGWSHASRLNEKDSVRRYQMLAAGWIGAAGITQLAFLIALTTAGADGPYPVLLGIMFFCLSAIPAARVNLNVVKHEHENRRAPVSVAASNTTEMKIVGDKEMPELSFWYIPLLPILLPIMISSVRKLSQPPRTNWKPVNPEEVPESIRHHLEFFDDDLAREGYLPLGFLAGERSRIRVWRHPTLGVAVMNVACGGNEICMSRHLYLESYYENGVMIFTYTNPAYEPLTSRAAGPRLLVVEGAPSFKHVVRVHTARVKEFEAAQKSPRRDISTAAEAAVRFDEYHADQLHLEERAGAWRLSPKDGKFHPTFRTVCKMCGLGMPIVFQIWRWRKRRERRATLARLGMGE